MHPEAPSHSTLLLLPRLTQIHLLKGSGMGSPRTGQIDRIKIILDLRART